MSHEEAELFIKGMELVRDVEGIPSIRRYFRSNNSIIAEGKWATTSEVKEAKSPVLVMAEQEAIMLEQRRQKINATESVRDVI